MKVTIELPAEIEASLVAQAQAEGLNVSDFVQHLVRERVSTNASRPAYELPPDEWVSQFEVWTRGHAGRNLPVLTDEAMSRESLYGDRGL